MQMRSFERGERNEDWEALWASKWRVKWYKNVDLFMKAGYSEA